MAFTTTQGSRVLRFLVPAVLLVSFFFIVNQLGSDTWKGSASDYARLPESLSRGGSKAPEPKPANATLDFQEIIYLSLPYRTDRQDALSLIAAVSGLKLTMLPGVMADEIHTKAMPGSVGGENLTGTPALGIWRAHANVWRYMIDNDVQSALIIEDDVDWDVNIKDMMGNLNWQLRYNNTIRWGKDNVNKGWEEDCPYGCDWDYLSLGQCGGGNNIKRLDLHQVFPEPNTANFDSQMAWVKFQLKEDWKVTECEGISVVSAAWGPICLMAYGLSQMGARRMLYNIGGWHPLDHAVDIEIALRTQDGKLSGYTLTPPLFTYWRSGGSQDSDNDQELDGRPVNTEGPRSGASTGIKSSVRRYMQEYFAKNYWEDMKDQIRW